MMKRIKRIVLYIIRLWWGLFYDKKYLSGRHFSTEYYSKGWAMLPKLFFSQKIVGINKNVPWPCAPTILIGNPDNIEFDIDDIDNFFTGYGYYQGIGAKIKIGHGTPIAPGVGMITANHDLSDVEKNQPGQDIVIGDKCWLGMHVMILPGVVLGNHTIVGAGSIVTKSFPEGNCVIAGNPAKVIRRLTNGECQN